VRIVQDLAKEHTLEEIFSDHVHPTALANRAMADALAAKIAAWMLTRSID
jgi:phospholipase/lecithinase/hemolysin